MSEPRPRLLLVHDDAPLLHRMAAALARLGEPLIASGPAEALEHLAAGPIDLLVVAWPDSPLLGQVRERHPEISVIGIGSCAREPADRVRALQAGVQDLLAVPPDPRELELVARRCLAWGSLQRELARLRGEVAQREDFHLLLGVSPAMLAARHTLRQAASTDVPVLLVGEGGTGREWAARALHAAGPRRGGPFVSLDASAFPPAVLDEELFGWERGVRPGRVAAAEGGTLFLAEITALPIELQARLLERLAVRLDESGATHRAPADVRMVASAGEDVDAQAESGRFHPEMHRLLSAVTVRLPPLRERPEDIPVLAGAFLDRLCRQNHAAHRSFSPDAMEALTSCAWKGNVRELRHIIECLVLQPGAELVTRRDLPRALQSPPSATAPITVTLPDGGLQLDQQLTACERALLVSALARTDGRKKEAAVLLGLNKDQMKYLCRKHGL